MNAPLPTLTLADVYRIAADLVSLDDINVANLSVWADKISILVRGAADLAGGARLLDDPAVTMRDTRTEDAIMVTVSGTYRGVRTEFFDAVRDGDSVDLIRRAGGVTLAALDELAVTR